MFQLRMFLWRGRSKEDSVSLVLLYCTYYIIIYYERKILSNISNVYNNKRKKNMN